MNNLTREELSDVLIELVTTDSWPYDTIEAVEAAAEEKAA
jgi:hypothetical protein